MSTKSADRTMTDTNDKWQVRFKQVPVLLNPRLHAAAQAAAHSEGISFSAFVRQAIENELRKLESR